ncbi:unnamed protein product [Bemisia tabaci]|uniref:Nucleolar protein 16 n=1 Tax=Bemisia tabaci TaxID=7038 RepID=A0A9P0AMP1_BEMTA|nr:PREDICTED: nucleolar protein 16 [Bemisia tabaci]CAH0395123.1 unnamed protein product [Bemisia tabaci]
MKIRKHVRNKRRVVKNVKKIYKKLRAKQVPKFDCEEIKEAWARGRTLGQNFKDMGLAVDPNKAVKTTFGTQDSEEEDSDSVPQLIPIPKKKHVAEALEADAKAPRERKIRLPDGEVRFIAQLMTRYGDNYEKMARDNRNKWQWTPAQFRAKIKRFMTIDDQYKFYLNNRKAGCKWRPEDPNFGKNSNLERDLF